MELAVSLMVAVGLGGVLGAYFQSRFQHKKDVEEDIHKLKRTRYGAIVILMLTILNPESMSKTQQFRPDLKDVEAIKEEVKTEMLHGVLFANDDVVRAMAEFVKNPDSAAYVKAVSAMRKDLWGKDTRVGEDILREFAP